MQCSYATPIINVVINDEENTINKLSVIYDVFVSLEKGRMSEKENNPSLCLVCPGNGKNALRGFHRTFIIITHILHITQT